MIDVPNISSSDVIAFLALLIAVYSAWHQRAVNATQQRVNEFLLQQGENEALDARKADLGANFIKLGNNKHRLKIWNKGKATARNIRIEFPDGNDIVDEGDIRRKFPLEALDQFQPVELLAMVTWGSNGKQHIKLVWDDDSGSDNEKSIYATI